MLPSRDAQAHRAYDGSHRVRPSSNHSPGPTFRSLIVLTIGTLALLATTPAPPTLSGRVIGQVVIDGGQTIDRELRIHVDPDGGEASRGSIYLDFQAASGLQTSYTRDVTLSLVSASDANGPIQPTPAFPVERCQIGCDLVYRIQVAAGPGVLPGSIVRYDVDVELQYDTGFAPRNPALMRLELEGTASGPVAPIWALIAGIVGLAGGILAGPAIDRRLPTHLRRAPSIGLLALAVGLIGWLFVVGVLNVVGYGRLDLLSRQPLALFFVADPWSVVLLGTLAWGLWRGYRRWPGDGGWLLGLSAVAMVGLGGLWLAWRSTLDVAVQPIVVTALMVLLGALGGLVIGQAWRTDPRANHDRWWAAFAVLSQGILIAGFGFLAERSFYDPFATSQVSFLALIPAGLLALAFRRWLSGRRFWLALFDIVIAGVGLLGVWLWSTSFIGFTTVPARLEIDDVAVYLAVAASLVATVTAFHEMPSAQHAITPPAVGGDPSTT
jgi:hypothetical protein